MELDVEVLGNLLTEAARTQFGQDLMIVGFIWLLMKNKVTKHFESVELSLKTLAENVLEVKSALLKVEQSHLARFKSVEDNLITLGERVMQLEEKQHGDN